MLKIPSEPSIDTSSSTCSMSFVTLIVLVEKIAFGFRFGETGRVGLCVRLARLKLILMDWVTRHTGIMHTARASSLVFQSTNTGED